MASPIASPRPTPWAGALLSLLAFALGLGLWAASLSLCDILVDVRALRELAALMPGASDPDQCLSSTPVARVALKLRVLGGALILAAGTLWLARDRLVGALRELGTSARASSRALATALVHGIKAESKVHLFALLAAVLLGVTLRVGFLFQPMRFDEAITFTRYAAKPWYIGLADYSDVNNHVLHTLLVHVVTRIFGSEPWVIRLPALAAGVLTVPATYLVTRLYFDRRAALLAAGVAAASSTLVLFSSYARGYSIVALIFLICLALAKHLKDNGNPVAWSAFAALAALGLFTIPVMLYPLGVVALWLLLAALVGDTAVDRRLALRRLSLSLSAAAALALVLYLPVILVHGPGALVANPYVQPRSAAEFYSQLIRLPRALWGDFTLAAPTWAALGLAAGFVSSVIFHRRVSRDRVPLVLAVLGWCLPFLLLNRRVPYTRVWHFLLPLMAALASAGISLLARSLEMKWKRLGRVLFVAVAGAIVASMSIRMWRHQVVYYSDEGGTLRDAPAIAAFLSGNLEAGDRLVVAPPSSAPLTFYLDALGANAAQRSSLGSDPSASTRLVVVVNHRFGRRVDGVWQDETIGDVLRAKRVSAAGYGAPRLLRRYRFASVYEMRRTAVGRGPTSAAQRRPPAPPPPSTPRSCIIGRF